MLGSYSPGVHAYFFKLKKEFCFCLLINFFSLEFHSILRDSDFHLF